MIASFATKLDRFCTIFVFKWAIPGLFCFYFRLSNAFDSKG